jgi:DNA-binding PadR family transcriptional regulator
MRDNVKGRALTETTFLILLSVYTTNHGYEMIKFIESETKGRVILGAGTLYGAINTLLKKEWIIPCEEERVNRKKKYVISDKGKRVAENELKRLKQVIESAEKIMGGML